MNEDKNKPDVFLYETPRNISFHKIDIAAMNKCYGYILQGETEDAVRIVNEIINDVNKKSLSEQEKRQLFYTIRQPVYNACIEITQGKERDGFNCPEYSEKTPFHAQLSDLSDFCVFLCEKSKDLRKRKETQTISDVMLFIINNYTDVNLTAFAIASKFNVSEKYIFKIVKQQKGTTLGKLIEDMRIEHAEKLLMTTDHTNAKITQVTGFGSENTFYRAFLKKHGMTPNIWKKSQNHVR